MIRPIGLLACLLVFTAAAQNQAPVVNAGNDTSTTVGAKFRFKATVTDDTLPSPHTITTLWTLVTGPTDSVAFQGAFIQTQFVFNTAGDYTFALSATDGELTASDTVKITVYDSVPFVVLTPKAGDTICIGDSVLVSWQIAPPAAVTVSFSDNDGRTWTYITAEAVRQGTTWYWHVPADFTPVSNGRLEVATYVFPHLYAYQGPLVVMARPQGVAWKRPPHSVSAGNVTHVDFLLDGRRLVARGNSRATPSAHGVVIRQMQGSLAGALKAVVVQ